MGWQWVPQGSSNWKHTTRTFRQQLLVGWPALAGGEDGVPVCLCAVHLFVWLDNNRLLRRHLADLPRTVLVRICDGLTNPRYVRGASRTASADGPRSQPGNATSPRSISVTRPPPISSRSSKHSGKRGERHGQRARGKKREARKGPLKITRAPGLPPRHRPPQSVIHRLPAYQFTLATPKTNTTLPHICWKTSN